MSAELETEFIQKLLCDGRINHDQYSYLICNTSLTEGIKELGLSNEYRNFVSMVERNQQDTSYQISMINDMIAETKNNLANVVKEYEGITHEYEDKLKAYDSIRGRWLKFQDNPRFTKEMEDSEKDFNPIREKYLNGQKMIKEYQDSIRTWENQLIDLN